MQYIMYVSYVNSAVGNSLTSSTSHSTRQHCAKLCRISKLTLYALHGIAVDLSDMRSSSRKGVGLLEAAGARKRTNVLLLNEFTK